MDKNDSKSSEGFEGDNYLFLMQMTAILSFGIATVGNPRVKVIVTCIDSDSCLRSIAMMNIATLIQICTL